MVERVMELLVDSGIAYTSIWASGYVHAFLLLTDDMHQLLYCISFFRPITTQIVQDGSSETDPELRVTAAFYLNAAMAQITVRGSRFSQGHDQS